MMAKQNLPTKVLMADKPFETWYLNYAGLVCSKFLTELRDHNKILAIKCPQCKRVLVPARPVCAKCFKKTEEWVEVSDKGTLITYTTVSRPTLCQSIDAPVIYGIILLDGASTGLLHMIGEVDPEDIEIGMRLQAVFEEKRTGDIRDIKHFRPEGSSEKPLA